MSYDDIRLWCDIMTFLDVTRKVESEAGGTRKSEEGNEEAPRVRRNLTDVCVFTLVLTGSDTA